MFSKGFRFVQNWSFLLLKPFTWTKLSSMWYKVRSSRMFCKYYKLLTWKYCFSTLFHEVTKNVWAFRVTSETDGFVIYCKKNVMWLFFEPYRACQRNTCSKWTIETLIFFCVNVFCWLLLEKLILVTSYLIEIN